MAGTNLCPVDKAVKKRNKNGCLPRTYDLGGGGAVDGDWRENKIKMNMQHIMSHGEKYFRENKAGKNRENWRGVIVNKRGKRRTH